MTRTPWTCAAPRATSAGPLSAPLTSTATATDSRSDERGGAEGIPSLVLVLVIVIVVVHVHDLATAVEPAMRAHAVGTARPVALRAAVDRGRGDLVLRPPLRGARVRLLLLGDGHSRRRRVANR